MEILLSLISGVIGALLGGVLAYIGAINATKKQIDFLYALEKESRTYAEKQQREAMTCALALEIEENIYLATDLWAGSSPRDVVVNTTSLLSTEAWTTYRGNISSLPSSLQIKLLHAYTQIRQFNTLVEDNRRYSIKNDLVSEAIKFYGKRVLETCKAVKEEITKV